HCAIGRLVEMDYRALHDVETTAPAGITFYSGAWGRPFAIDRASVVDAIAAHATGPVDFPAGLEPSYARGVRVFLQGGPGSSCTRLIGRILGSRPHLARSACRPDRDPLAAVLEILGEWIANRLPVDLGPLYAPRAGRDVSSGESAPAGDSRGPAIRIVV